MHFSELLQSLDMCENDPVAIARCFVDKVRGTVLFDLQRNMFMKKINICDVFAWIIFPQSEYFEIYTQYCTNYPK